MARAMNRGIAEARAPFVAQMDSDDVALPNRLAIQLNALRQMPGVDFMGTSMYCIGSDGSPIIPHPWAPLMTDSDHLAWALPFGNVLAGPTMLSRTDALRANPYSEDEMFRYCVDYELWCRINWRHKIANIPVPTMRYRMHQNQGSIENGLSQAKAAAECSRRAVEELVQEPVSTQLMEILRESKNPKLTLSRETSKEATAFMTRMLIAFLKRKLHKGESVATVQNVINDYVVRVEHLTVATQCPQDEIIALINEQKNCAQQALQSLLNPDQPTLAE